MTAVEARCWKLLLRLVMQIALGAGNDVPDADMLEHKDLELLLEKSV